MAYNYTNATFGPLNFQAPQGITYPPPVNHSVAQTFQTEDVSTIPVLSHAVTVSPDPARVSTYNYNNWFQTSAEPAFSATRSMSIDQSKTYNDAPSTPYEYTDPWGEYVAQNDSFVSIQEKALNENQANLSEQQSVSSEYNGDYRQSFWCDPCKIDLISKKQFDMHIAGKNHAKKLKALEATSFALGHFVSGLEKKIFTCELCKITMNGADVFQNHLKGLKHEKKLQQRSQNELGQINYYCEICYMELGVSRLAFDAHLDGKSHAKRLELGKIQYEILDPGKIAYYCEICHLPHGDPGSYLEHLRSERHAKRLQLQEKGYNLNPPGSGAIATPGLYEKNLFWCDVCKVMTTGFPQYDNHIISQKHQNKIKLVLEKLNLDEKKAQKQEEKLDSHRLQTLVPMSFIFEEDKILKKNLFKDPEELEETPKILDDSFKKKTIRAASSRVKTQSHFSRKQLQSDSDIGQHHCDTCHANLSSEKMLEAHLNGQPHLKKEKIRLLSEEKKKEELGNGYESLESKILSTGPRVLEGEIFCPLCNLKMMQVHEAEAHFASPKHRNKIKHVIVEHKKNDQTNDSIGIPFITGHDVNPQQNLYTLCETQFICDVCFISASSEAQFETHIVASKHLKMVIKVAAFAGNNLIVKMETDEDIPPEPVTDQTVYNLFFEILKKYENDTEFQKGFTKVMNKFKEEDREKKRLEYSRYGFYDEEGYYIQEDSHGDNPYSLWYEDKGLNLTGPGLLSLPPGLQPVHPFSHQNVSLANFSPFRRPYVSPFNMSATHMPRNRFEERHYFMQGYMQNSPADGPKRKRKKRNNEPPKFDADQQEYDPSFSIGSHRYRNPDQKNVPKPKPQPKINASRLVENKSSKNSNNMEHVLEGTLDWSQFKDPSSTIASNRQDISISKLQPVKECQEIENSNEVEYVMDMTLNWDQFKDPSSSFGKWKKTLPSPKSPEKVLMSEKGTSKAKEKNNFEKVNTSENC